VKGKPDLGLADELLQLLDLRLALVQLPAQGDGIGIQLGGDDIRVHPIEVDLVRLEKQANIPQKGEIDAQVTACPRPPRVVRRQIRRAIDSD